jgi:hypothetical protein
MTLIKGEKLEWIEGCVKQLSPLGSETRGWKPRLLNITHWNLTSKGERGGLQRGKEVNSDCYVILNFRRLADACFSILVISFSSPVPEPV